MSWEGYYQLICKNGHYWTDDASYMDDQDCICPICKSKPVWHNTVDITNGSFEGKRRIDGYKSLKPYQVIKCPTCKTTLEAKYKIPKQRSIR